MALRSDWSERPCPIARAMDYLGDPWTVLILRELMYGVHRFDELRQHTEASDKTLTDRLATMLDQGLIRREQYSGTARPRYEYHLTAAGEAAKPILNAMALWGGSNTEAPPLAQEFQIHCTSCGREVHTVEVCPFCGSSMTAGGTSWVRPEPAAQEPEAP